MKTRFKHILLMLAVGVVSLTSCDSFLDMTPVEQMTFEKIWQKRKTSEAYLATVYGYMPNHYDANGREQAIFVVTDESSASWPNYKGNGGAMANGTWGPSSISLSGGSNNNGDAPGAFGVPWVPYYRGIREATIFMNNIDKVPDNEIDPAKRAEYKVEARFLRAYYYAQLLRLYGPVVLIGEDLLDPTGSQAELSRARDSWADCMTYVVKELTEVAALLPLTQISTQLGRPTKGAALAAISRLTLYAARPLFNGNPMYADMANKDGKKLFDQTYDVNRWKVAADAAKAVIDLGIYDLYKDPANDPYKSCVGVFEQRWHNEIIHGRNAGSTNMAQHNTPRGGVDGWGGAYGGWGPTQQHVDAFAMKNGIYPITGYSSDGQPKIDPAAQYSEGTWSSFEHPLDKVTKNTNSMFQNREPRFYVNVFWSGQKWYQVGGKDAFFHTTGNSGPPEQDHARTGYLNRKFCPTTNEAKNGVFATFSWPYSRLAEIYLNYVEALNEFHGPSHADIKVYLNKIRSRAGVADLEVAYPTAFASKEALREYILKERRVELSFEGHRYFDTRTWMLKVDGNYVDAGPMYGMNIQAASSDPTGGFWIRTNTETRVFKDSFYLLPITQGELNKNHALTQNYGW